MSGVIVVDAGRSRSTCLGRDAYVMIIAWIVIIMWSSINCPTVICLPTVCYFSREKPLVKSTAPWSLSHIICLCDLFYLPFIFKSTKPKIQKYLAAIYFTWHLIYQYLQLSPARFPITGVITQKGLATPFTRRVASICYLCAGAVYVVLLGSPTGSIPWFHN